MATSYLKILSYNFPAIIPCSWSDGYSKLQFRALVHRLDEINHDVSSLRLQNGSDEKYITNTELLALLKISKRTAYRWRESGRLPYVKIEKKLYYRTDTILDCFGIRPDSNNASELTPTGDLIPEELMAQMGCERCPLFVILNT